MVKTIPETTRTELLVQDETKKDQIALNIPSDPNVIFDTSAGEIKSIQVLVLKGLNNNGQQGTGSDDGLGALTWAAAKKNKFASPYAIGKQENSPDSWRSGSNRKKRYGCMLMTQL
jgi:hypothetical protein